MGGLLPPKGTAMAKRPLSLRDATRSLLPRRSTAMKLELTSLKS